MTGFDFAERALAEGAVLEVGEFRVTRADGRYSVSRAGSLDAATNTKTLGGAVHALATMAAEGDRESYGRATHEAVAALVALGEERELEATGR